METIWLTSALWIGLALLASLISIRVAVSVALIEIVVGALAGNLLAMAPTDWVNYLAGVGAVVLTFLAGSEITTLDFAKAMIDEGVHPMTMYFPLVVHGALLIEPTETEGKESLDLFVDLMRGLAEKAKSENAAEFKEAPRFTPRRRLDETRAARQPVLRWTPPETA